MRSVKVCALFAALFAAVAIAPPPGHAAPVEVYGRLPDVEDVGISPDGTRLAFAGVAGDNRVLSVIDVGSKSAVVNLNIGKAKLRGLSWIDDGHLLIVASTTSDLPFEFINFDRQEFQFGFVYDITARKLTPLQIPADKAKALNTVYGRPIVRQVGGRTLVFFAAQTFNENHGVFSLASYDPATRNVRIADDGRPGVRDFAVDSAGNPVVENIWQDGRWRLRLKVNGVWRDLPAVDMPEGPPAMLGMGPAGQAILFVGQIEGKNGWHALSLKDGSWQPVNYPAGELMNDQQTGLGLGLRRETDHYMFNFFDPAMQTTWDAILRAFPGEQVDFVSISRDRKKVVVKVFGQTNGAAYMLVDMNTGHADLISDIYHDVTPDQVAATRAVAYRAGDGMQIPAYLTLPKGRQARNLPLVVVPHGGPAARDELEFDWWAQALASRGYAVLQPEYRGSAGLTGDLLRSGYGEWGRKMQTDLSDGVRFLAAQGVIDPKRVCIAGASYGGYAALAGVTLDPGVYRCAVDVSGPSDLKRFVQWSQNRSGEKRVVAYWDRYMQAEAQKDPTYGQISPIGHIDKINVPVLVIHGRDDTVVPFQQSQWMVDSMKAAGKPVEFLPLAGEDHWLSRSATRQQMLTALVKFIETHNPPDPPAAVADNR